MEHSVCEFGSHLAGSFVIRWPWNVKILTTLDFFFLTNLQYMVKKSQEQKTVKLNGTVMLKPLEDRFGF